MAIFRYKCEQLLKHIQDLQCHKCQDVPGPSDEKKNRYFCFNESHVLCENHKAKCPCGSLVGKKPVFAKLLEDLPWMCQNYKHGCREIEADVKELEYHQRKCIFRLVNCLRLSCKNNILFKDVLDHVKIIHGGDKLYKLISDKEKMLTAKPYQVSFKYTMKTINFPTQAQKPHYWATGKIVSSDGFMFYDALFLVNNTFHFWVYVLGSSDEAKNFSCAYTVKNMIGETFNYSGPVHTLDESKDDIISSGSCFTMLENAVIKSLDEEKSLAIHLTIRNLKEELKNDDIESGISVDD